ncbi:MAG: ABC transporter substrate-binding protein [Acidimicrobiales bacterium]
MSRRTFRSLVAVLAAVLILATACGDDDSSSGGPGEGSASTEASELRLGYFPNVTHAPGIVGIRSGIFDDAVGDDVTIELRSFNAGGEAVEALFSDALDITFIGPNPAINGFAQSRGEAVRLISGTTSGGAFLVVRPGIDAPEDLQGAVISTPALGNTQDVALRAWLLEEGFDFDETGSGDVSIRPQGNPDILTGFLDGQIDAAWVPEPWATRLIEEGGGQVLVDERDLWPDGRFVTTHVLVRTEFLEENPQLVKRFLEGVVEAIDYTNDNPDEAQELTNAGITEVAGNAVDPAILAASWANLTFTWDPVAASLVGSKDDAVAVGLLEEVDLEGIYALDLLNEVLAELGRDPVEGL